ncbi:MAG: HAMP domain-containing histidine kinase [Deltaproteobacteria bacterium]|nr:MAG: HAMP domain-containing histidine kinase [Deltaproteobacteria bacterium]
MSHDLDQAFEFLKKKEQDYTAYKFRTKETMAIFAFFDLAQEFASLSNLYRIAVAVIKFFFNYESRIYTIRPEDEALMLQCCTSEGLLDPPVPARADIVTHDSPYRSGSSFLFPIIGKKALADKAPLFLDDQILGMFEIYPVKKMGERELLFLSKYANRVGYNMHNKLVVEQNLGHIRFINQLVSDIEHNVITPNLYYKAFLINMKKNLKRYLSELEGLSSILPKTEAIKHFPEGAIIQAVDNLNSIHQDMGKKMEEFERHFNHLSLFIETLFRGEHFKTGGYVLKRRSYNLLRDVFLPELEHYRKRLEDKQIEIVEPSHVPSDKDLTISIDLGLTAQVFANLLSNALKYCQLFLDKHGNYRKYITYTIETVGKKSYETQNALKFSLFSSGAPISKEGALRIFEDGYKVQEDNSRAGAGHGLYFVNNIVQLHGGYADCKPREDGNDFYIVLPKVSASDRPGKKARS